jgi:hypothetical protein
MRRTFDIHDYAQSIIGSTNEARPLKSFRSKKEEAATYVRERKRREQQADLSEEWLEWTLATFEGRGKKPAVDFDSFAGPIVRD